MKDYKSTLNLPKTSFPMKADLPKREPAMYSEWEQERLYDELQERNASNPAFILHDGPPYANGDIHIGHALNKILKDIVIRYKTMQGFRTPYVPGWDCHGLPVELQLFKELGKTKHNVEVIEFREKARQYAFKYVHIQKEQFKRLGILGEWERPYLTMNYDYQAVIVESFSALYHKGYIYKGLKPIHWCASCETALAEAEVEYDTRTSPSIYVKFPLTPESCRVLELPEGANVLIWTTTPWTLPANVAVALRPDADYAVVQAGEEVFVIAQSLIPWVSQALAWTSPIVLKTLPGSKFNRLHCAHPFMGRESLLILGDHVTLDQGTGCVHTAPGHGQEDYEIGLAYNLPVLSPVNARGVFTEEVEAFEDQFVFDANEPICALLREKGYLAGQMMIEHSYPHCWRCKSPVIFRATKQWFIGVDRHELRQKSLEEIERIQWIPAAGKNRISSMVAIRPDWCLSRQRLWGVPIPIFYCDQCETEFLDEDTSRKVARLVREHGASIWFSLHARDLMPSGKKCGKCGHDKFCKEEDIIDVWFDSGVSHHAVLKKYEGLSYPADLYLEGSDQHRGWFQTSLLAGVALAGGKPFRAVLTHGFVVDGEGKKMSKSAGNVIAPQDVMTEYGADILRLWVSSTDFSQDVRISGEILAQIADTYRKIRNTFRYLLGNLFDYNREHHEILNQDLDEVDRWALSRLFRLHQQVTQAYERYEFFKIYHFIEQFCTVEMSSFYFDILKDRLYTFSANSRKRRAAQSVLFEILRVLNALSAPMLPFTMEEVWRAGAKTADGMWSVHLCRWPAADSAWDDPAIQSQWDFILTLRDEILKVLESARKSKVIGSALEASVTLYTDNSEIVRQLEGIKSDLRTLLIVSQASVVFQEPPWPEGHVRAGKINGLGVSVNKAQGDKCQRCWNYSLQVGRDGEHPALCERCIEAISG